MTELRRPHKLKVGIGTFPTDSRTTISAGKLAEDLGFDWFTLTDSPLYEDCYIHLALAAANTKLIALGPAVTSPVARHPAILASALSTLSEISGDRVRAVIGTGNSLARGLGLPPSKLVDLEDAVNLIKSYLSGEKEVEAKSVRLDRLSSGHNAEVFVAADGPKASKVAARCADAWMLGNGLNSEYRASLFQAAGVANDSKPVTRWWVSGAASTADSLEDVLDAVGGLVIGMAMRAFRTKSSIASLPDALKGELSEFIQNYNYGHHGDRVSPNWSLVSEDLLAFFFSRLCVWGPLEQWAETLGTLAKEGAEGMLFFVDHRDPLNSIQSIGDRLQALGFIERRH